jgi:hypothetical protein
MITLPTWSESTPAKGITIPAGIEKAVIKRPTLSWEIFKADLIEGRTGISMELPKTIIKGTRHKTANLSCVPFFI